MKHIIVILCLLLVAVVLLTTCGHRSPTPTEGREVNVYGGSYWGMTASQLNSMLDYKDFLTVEDKDFLLVNVRVPYAGEIAGTDLFVPYNEIEQNLFKFPQNKSTKIVLYCYTGRMSTIAARTLIELGFTNVWHLDRGLLDWEKQGYKLVYRL